MSQNNLGLTLRWLGTFEQDVAQLEGAKGAFLLSLQETAQEEEAFFWAGTQWNLADLALAHHELEPDPKLLIKAREHVLAAREVFADGSDYQTARCDELLARIEALSA